MRALYLSSSALICSSKDGRFGDGSEPSESEELSGSLESEGPFRPLGDGLGERASGTVSGGTTSAGFSSTGFSGLARASGNTGPFLVFKALRGEQFPRGLCELAIGDAVTPGDVLGDRRVAANLGRGRDIGPDSRKDHVRTNGGGLSLEEDTSSIPSSPCLLDKCTIKDASCEPTSLSVDETRLGSECTFFARR